MKITGRKSQSIGPLNPLLGPPPAEAQGEVNDAAPITDRVELGSSTEVRKLGQVAQAMPDIRVGKVSQLREAIDDGSYHIDSDQLARKVVDEAIRDILAREVRQMHGN
jgi:flagellar biosynthesis anti-sigma factor FlgM